jgi:hypothetical protein
MTMNHKTEERELTTDELVQVSGGNPIIAGLIILAGELAFIATAFPDGGCVAGCGATGGIFFK